MIKKLNTYLLAGAVSVAATMPAMAQDDPVQSAANGFVSTFQGDATSIGIALITAGFFALGFKWAKGMLFS